MSGGGFTDWLPRAAGTGGVSALTAVNGHAQVARTVAALCEQFADVCESAVDALEIASALELEGVSDQAAKRQYGYPDVFALAQDMYFRAPRRPAEPQLPADPWQDRGGFRPALHGLLYAAPGICFPAAIGLLVGTGVAEALIVALLAAWASGQGLAYLGYIRLGRTMDMDQTRRVLRCALAAGLALVAAALAATSMVVHAATSALLFGGGEGAYMLGAGVLMVVAAEGWLPVALAPGVLYSSVFLGLGRPPRLAHVEWAMLAATPLLALALAVIVTHPAAQPAGRCFDPAEWLGALPAVGFGLVAAGLLIFPVAAGPHGHGGINTGALLAALPLSLSMGAAEWSMLWYRRRTQRVMRSTRDLAAFGVRARLALLVALAWYLASAAALMAATVAVASATGLVRPRVAYLPQLGAYLALAGAMFLALLLLALGSRVFPLAACGAALAVEMAAREHGVVAQIITSTALLAVLGGFALAVLGRAVRHAY